MATAFNTSEFKRVLKLGFRKNELATLYQRSRQSIWAWIKYVESKGKTGSIPVDPLLIDRFNKTTAKILDTASHEKLPALDSTQRQAYVNNLLAALNTTTL